VAFAVGRLFRHFWSGTPIPKECRPDRRFEPGLRGCPLSADCVEKFADDYFKAIFVQRNFVSSFFLESSLPCPRVADSNITNRNGCRSFSTQSALLSHPAAVARMRIPAPEADPRDHPDDRQGWVVCGFPICQACVANTLPGFRFVSGADG
jgi:hypothetical protein